MENKTPVTMVQIQTIVELRYFKKDIKKNQDAPAPEVGIDNRKERRRKNHTPISISSDGKIVRKGSRFMAGVDRHGSICYIVQLTEEEKQVN